MELRQINHFLEIIQTGKLSDAAENLFISQPALTTSIKKLEDELGVKLFYRNHKGFTPTEAGTIFAEHAQKAVKELEKARSEIEQLRIGASRPLEIGIPSVSCGMVYPLLYQDFHEDHPEINFTINDVFSYDVIRRVQNEELEVGFGIYRGEYPEELSFVEVAQGEIVILVKADKRNKTQTVIPLEELRNKLWIFNRRTNSRQTTTEIMVTEHLRQRNLEVPRIKYVEDHHTIIRMVSMGVGIYPYPNTSNSDPFKDYPNLETKHMDQRITYRIGLIYKKNRSLSTSAVTLIRWFRAQNRSH